MCLPTGEDSTCSVLLPSGGSTQATFLIPFSLHELDFCDHILATYRTILLCPTGMSGIPKGRAMSSVRHPRSSLECLVSGFLDRCLGSGMGSCGRMRLNFVICQRKRLVSDGTKVHWQKRVCAYRSIISCILCSMLSILAAAWTQICKF